jgi:UrcA family protein
MNTLRKLIAGSAMLATIGLTAAAPVLARPDEVDIRTAHVRFADLNQKSPEGVVALYERLNAAARRVCEKSDDLALGLDNEARQCRVDALAHAVAQINNPMLTGLFQENAGRHAVRLAQG